ncbi:DMT family transporter [Mesorhizobium shangrilense]|uniref:DMT family transporter n=1 Tax=Mesorhizobium shangrilense TaxID=460060 RepID=A0ABV2DM95_9HYPH
MSSACCKRSANSGDCPHRSGHALLGNLARDNTGDVEGFWRPAHGNDVRHGGPSGAGDVVRSRNRAAPGPVQRRPLRHWAAIAVLALGGFVAAYTIWYGLLRRYRIDQVAPFALLMPIIGVLIAFLFLNERPSPSVPAGGAVILIGLGLVVRAPTAGRLERAGRYLGIIRN